MWDNAIAERDNPWRFQNGEVRTSPFLCLETPLLERINLHMRLETRTSPRVCTWSLSRCLQPRRPSAAHGRVEVVLDGRRISGQRFNSASATQPLKATFCVVADNTVRPLNLFLG